MLADAMVAVGPVGYFEHMESWCLPFLLFFLESDQKPDFQGRAWMGWNPSLPAVWFGQNLSRYQVTIQPFKLHIATAYIL